MSFAYIFYRLFTTKILINVLIKILLNSWKETLIRYPHHDADNKVCWGNEFINALYKFFL